MVTCAVPYANLPSNSANVLFLPTLVYLACKRNDTAFADVIDTSSLNRSSIDPLVNYRESPETDHRCGDTVTGHRSIHVSPLPSFRFSLQISPLFRIYLSFLNLFTRHFHPSLYFFFPFHLFIYLFLLKYRVMCSLSRFTFIFNLLFASYYDEHTLIFDIWSNDNSIMFIFDRIVFFFNILLLIFICFREIFANSISLSIIFL